MPAEFELYKDAQGEFRFRLQADNNEVVAASEGYATKAGCQAGIAAVRKVAPTAPINDLT